MMSKICPKCKAVNRDQSKFCSSCGAGLGELPPTAVFKQPTPGVQPPTEKMRSVAQPQPPQANRSNPAVQHAPKKRRGFGWVLAVLLLLLVGGAGAFMVLGNGLPSFGADDSGNEPVAFDDGDEEEDVEGESEGGETAVSDEEPSTPDPLEEPTAATISELLIEEEPTPTIAPTQAAAVEELVEAEPNVVEPTAVEPTVTIPPTATSPPDVTPLIEANGLTVYREPSAQTGIRVEIRYFDGSPKDRSGVGIFTQQTDVSNNPVYGDRIAAGRTDATGAIFFPLDVGTYAVGLDNLIGGPWGNPFNYEVIQGQATVLSLTLGRLVIGVRNADEQPLERKWTAVYSQTTDVNGNPIKGECLSSGSTDNTGSVVYHMVPGVYAIEIADLLGEPWGSETNHAIASGETTNLLITMGRMTVGVKDANDEPLRGHWVGIYFQGEDVEGNPAKGARIVSGRTDDRGLIRWAMTPGTYAIEITGVDGELWGTNLTIPWSRTKKRPLFSTWVAFQWE